MRRLIDALSRNAPASEVQPLRDALPEVYQQQNVPAELRQLQYAQDSIPAAYREALEEAGFTWMPAPRVYYHLATRAMIPFEELIECDAAWLHERITQALAGRPRDPE